MLFMKRSSCCVVEEDERQISKSLWNFKGKGIWGLGCHWWQASHHRNAELQISLPTASTWQEVRGENILCLETAWVAWQFHLPKSLWHQLRRELLLVGTDITSQRSLASGTRHCLGHLFVVCLLALFFCFRFLIVRAFFLSLCQSVSMGSAQGSWLQRGTLSNPAFLCLLPDTQRSSGCSQLIQTHCSELSFPCLLIKNGRGDQNQIQPPGFVGGEEHPVC